MSGNKQAESDESALVEALRQNLWQQLAESGEERTIKENLRRQLAECGWRDAVKAQCQSVISARGMDITVEELIGAISGPASTSVPTDVRDELVLKLKTFLASMAAAQQTAAAAPDQ